jgi:hypothetical protein
MHSEGKTVIKGAPNFSSRNPSLACICLTLTLTLFPVITRGNDAVLQLYHSLNQWGSTNVWLVSIHSLTNAPKWTFGKEPPLSVSKAIRIAKAYLVTGTNEVYWIEDIRLTPVGPTSESGIYYYNILFGGTSYVGHCQRCILLMDGTIVHPRILGAKSRDYSPWAFDE